MRSYATIYATLYGVFAVGAGGGPSLFGYVFGRTGSYSEIPEVCAVLLIGGAATLLLLGPYPQRGATEYSDGLRQGKQPSKTGGMAAVTAGSHAAESGS